jgi:hypothetical protein
MMPVCQIRFIFMANSNNTHIVSFRVFTTMKLKDSWGYTLLVIWIISFVEKLINLRNLPWLLLLVCSSFHVSLVSLLFLHFSSNYVALLICLENSFWYQSMSFTESFQKAFKLYMESGTRDKVESALKDLGAFPTLHCNTHEMFVSSLSKTLLQHCLCVLNHSFGLPAINWNGDCLFSPHWLCKLLTYPSVLGLEMITAVPA